METRGSQQRNRGCSSDDAAIDWLNRSVENIKHTRHGAWVMLVLDGFGWVWITCNDSFFSKSLLPTTSYYFVSTAHSTHASHAVIIRCWGVSRRSNIIAPKLLIKRSGWETTRFRHTGVFGWRSSSFRNHTFRSSTIRPHVQSNRSGTFRSRCGPRYNQGGNPRDAAN